MESSHIFTLLGRHIHVYDDYVDGRHLGAAGDLESDQSDHAGGGGISRRSDASWGANDGGGVANYGPPAPQTHRGAGPTFNRLISELRNNC